MPDGSKMDLLLAKAEPSETGVDYGAATKTE